MRPVLLSASLLLVLAACDTLAPLTTSEAIVRDGLSLQTDKEAYQSGEVAQVTLRHAGTGRYVSGVLECARLERWDGEGWEPVDMDRACIMIAVYTEPGTEQTAGIPLDVPRGTYRITHGLSLDGGDRSVTVSTAAFQVA
jgi:hypothetical protein